MKENPATEVDRAALDAVKKLGMTPVEVSIPDWPYDSLDLILFAEAAAAFEDLTLSGGLNQLKVQVPDAWPNVFRQARFLSAVDFVQADRLRRKVAIEMARVFSQVDLLLVPSLRDEMLTITNFTGHPSLTLRAGFRRGFRGAQRLGTGPERTAAEVLAATKGTAAFHFSAARSLPGANKRCSTVRKTARSTANSKRRFCNKVARTWSMEQDCQSLWKMSAGPILVWRVAMLSARACAPRRHSFSEKRARDRTSASSWPLARSSSRRPRRAKTRCFTLPSAQTLSTRSR
jgi:hypothetical protein